MEIVTVNFKTPDLTERLIDSIRKVSPVPIRVIDGSDTEEFQRIIREVCGDYSNVICEQVGFNLHHGPSMHRALNESTHEFVLFMDSDTELLDGMLEKFHYTHFYEGFACWVNDSGINVEKGIGILYLHPEILLVNVEKYRQSPYKFKKHGAPCIDAMHYTPNSEKLIIPDEYRNLYKRIGRATVNRWGYNL